MQWVCTDDSPARLHVAYGALLLCPAEVDEFLQQTEKYIKDLTHRLVNYKAKEEAQEAAQEAIAEVGQSSQTTGDH